MAHLGVNFDDVPDEFVALEPGIYTAIVREVNQEPTSKGDSEKLVVKLEVNQPGTPFHERSITDHISVKMLTKIKNLMQSCGVPPGKDGLDTETLIGKTCKIRCKGGTYKDRDTGETKPTTRVEEYLRS